MLYQLGVLRIKVAPFNVDGVSRQSKTDFVAKPVVGRRPPREYVGEGDTSFVLTGKLFPKVVGGLTELALLDAMRISGHPQFLLRGDGFPFGWVSIEGVSTNESHLAEDGVGQVTEVSIELHSAQAPSQINLFSILSGLFT